MPPRATHGHTTAGWSSASIRHDTRPADIRAVFECHGAVHVKPTLNSVQIQARITELKNGAKRRKALSPRTNALFSARKRAQSTAPKRVSFAVQEKFIEYELPVKTQEFHDMWAVQSIGTAFRVAFDEVHTQAATRRLCSMLWTGWRAR
jgi:hypothetical protein